jgi:hypothetical protein
MTSAERVILEQLGQENQTLRARLSELERTVRELLNQNQQLQEKCDQQAQAAARQAAPFRRRESRKVADDAKKRSGRRKGHLGVYRPVPDHIDDHADVPLTGCPRCGGPVTPVEQFIEEIPPVRPRVTHLITYRGVCPTCGEVHSTHPLQTAMATGAAKTQLGPRAHALATALNKQYGLTMRKVCRVLHLFAGLKFSPGGLAQAVQRNATKVLPAFDSLVTEVRAADAVFADETSWYVGAAG